MAKPRPRPIIDVTTQLWPDPDTGPWYVRLTWVELDGRAECIGVELWSGASPVALNDGRPGYVGIHNGPTPALASTVRDLPLAAIIRAGRRQLVPGLEAKAEWQRFIASTGGRVDHEHAQRQRARADTYEQLLAIAKRSIDLPRSGTGVGRKPELTSEHFAEVAAVYLEAHNNGNPPTQAVAARFHISKSAAAKRVARARAAGLIAPTSVGKASGPTTTRSTRPRKEDPK